MGGKTKQSQRTKNNVRPSSSGRSALLLNNVKLEAGKMNIAGTELPALFPTLIAPKIDPLVSPELQLCLKKLNKKDPITKTKALQELSELVLKSQVDDVVAVLPSWVHFYKILTTDPDRKVREVTQSCHGTIVSVCGRRVAPHLKQLMPSWLQAQYDEHAPAQTNAQNSLAKTFPDSKLPEVISFCKNEVMTHIVDNLIGTGEAAFIKQTDGAEERAAAAARAQCRGLHALRYCAEHVPRAHDAWLAAALARLLAAPAFWAAAAHQDDTVRAAWYAAVGRVAARGGAQFAAAHGQRTLRLLLAAKETAPLPAAQLWDCLLLFMHSVEDWYKYLDKKELLNKRIFDLLESGGWGDARRLAQLLLPLLALLARAGDRDRDFYVAFFDAILKGLEKKTILSSKSERQSWITSLEECLRYLSVQPQDYVQEVVSAVQRAWLEGSLARAGGPAGDHLVKYSAGKMAALVKYWLRQANDSNSDKYDALVRNFWQNVGATVAAQLDRLPADSADSAGLIAGHILFLQTLKTAFADETKKRHSIKFDGDAPRDDDAPPDETPPCEASVVERYNHNLDDLVEKVCGQYFEFAGRKRVSTPVLAPLSTLLAQFDSARLCGAVARHCGCAGALAFYDAVLRGWLAADSMRCSALVDIVFLFLNHLTEPEQDAVFDSFKQFPPAVVEWCMRRALAAGASSAAQRWLRGALVQATVVQLCRRLTEHGGAEDLLLDCLGTDRTGEIAIGSPAASLVLAHFSGAVCGAEGAALARVAALAARLAAAAPSAPGLDALVLALFRLSVQEAAGGARLGPAARAVRAAWAAALQALPAEQRRRTLAGAAAALHQALRLRSNLNSDLPPELIETSDDKENTAPVLDAELVSRAVALCPALWRGARGAAELVGFTRHALGLAPAPASRERLLLCALRHSIVRSDLNCPLEDDQLTAAITEDHLRGVADASVADASVADASVANASVADVSVADVAWFVNGLVFRALYLRAVLQARVDEERPATWGAELLRHDYVLQQCCAVLRDCAVLATLADGFAYWPHYNVIKEANIKLESFVQDIVSGFCPTTMARVVAATGHLAAARGYYWAYAYNRLCRLRDNVLHNTSKVTTEAISEKGEVDDESNQETTETRQENIDNTEENHESSQGNIEDNKGHSEPSQEIIESIQRHIEDSRGESESVERGAESSQIVTEVIEDTTQGPIQTDDLCVDLYTKDTLTGNGYFHTLQAELPRHALCTRRLLMLRSFRAARAGAGAALRARLDAGAARCRPADDDADADDDAADVVINAYYEHNDVMLFERDVRAAPWAEVASSAAVADYLCELVAWRGWALAPHRWDFATIAACNLLSSVLRSRAAWGSTKVALLTRATLQLFLAVERFISEVPSRSEKEQPSAHVAHLPTEWRDIFAPDLLTNLFTLVDYVLEQSASNEMSSTRVAVIDALVRCTRRADWSLLPGARRRGALALHRLAPRAAAVLRRAAHPAYKYLAYELLAALRRPLVAEDEEKLAAWSAAAEAAGEAGAGAGAPPLSLQLYLDDAFTELRDIVETAVAHVKVGEATCSLVPRSDAHALAAGWLLLARAAAAQARAARADLHHHYLQLYRRRRYAAALLPVALRLLPADVFARAQDDAPPLPEHAALFASPPPLDVYEYCGTDVMGAFACQCLVDCTTGMGTADARGWRGAAPHRHARLLDNIVRGYISPNAVKAEFTLVQQKAHEIEDTEITILWSAFELSCVLTVEERRIELRVQLSPSHPLGLPRLTSPDHAPIGNTNWLLMYMGYQAGSVLGALRMWAAAVTSRVEQSPQCYICYCHLHFADGRLPAVRCYQCRNKYHTACLRKWFTTSNKSNCPLCRAAF